MKEPAKQDALPQQPQPSLAHRRRHSFLTRVYFEGVHLRHEERIPQTGPVLFLGLHRNGAVDGFVYNSVLPPSVFMLSRQLKTHLGRPFFDGIEVVRDKDRERFPDARQVNQKAMRQCRKVLTSGGRLFIFPEGTSSLGPRHLPFRSGAARLIHQFVEAGSALQVIPVGITYEGPDQFRSQVEVIVGNPIPLSFDMTTTPRKRLNAIKERIAVAMESVGINVESQDRLERIESLAYGATLGTNFSCHRALKALEKDPSRDLEEALTQLDQQSQFRALKRHQGVPLFCLGGRLPYLAYFLLLLPGVAAAGLLNCLPLALSCMAGRRFADDRNVVSLWRILAAAPAFAIWIPMMLSACWALLGWAGPLIYLGVTLLGLKSWYRFKKLWIALHNEFRHPESKAEALSLQANLSRQLGGRPVKPSAPSTTGALASSHTPATQES